MKKQLTEEQFQASIKGLEVGPQTLEIARGVLVEGRQQASFAQALGLSRGAVSQAVQRVWAAFEAKSLPGRIRAGVGGAAGASSLHRQKMGRRSGEKTGSETMKIGVVAQEEGGDGTEGAPRDRGPLMIDISLIDEDPHQPRTAENPGFRKQSIAELAASFGPKGPKTPLSLRDNEEIAGRYIINHGHRRYRASKVKGLSAVPAFIDNEYDDDDQIIENIQREGQSPREIATRIAMKQNKGEKNKQIAARWGKSAAWVTQYAALNDLPEPIAEVFNTGRANDVTVVNELVTAYKRNPEEVKAWLSVLAQEVSRGEVKLLREFLTEKNKASGSPRDADPVHLVTGKTDTEADEAEQGNARQKDKAKEAEPHRLKKAIVQVLHDGRNARLVLTKRPPAEGYAWLKYEDDGQETEAALADVQLVAVLEG